MYTMRKRTVELCNTIISNEVVPVRISADGAVHSVPKLTIWENKNKIPHSVLEKLAEYLDDNEVLIICHRRVAEKF